MKRPNDMKRGNDPLYKQRGEADEFDHYLGPFGGDVRQSIQGATVNNRDELDGFQVQKKGRGMAGPKRTRSTRRDESDY